MEQKSQEDLFAECIIPLLSSTKNGYFLRQCFVIVISVKEYFPRVLASPPASPTLKGPVIVTHTPLYLHSNIQH